LCFTIVNFSDFVIPGFLVYRYFFKKNHFTAYKWFR